MNIEIEQLKLRISQLEKIVNEFSRADRFYFPRNIQISNSASFILPAENGVKFGTSSTQKLGFWNTTPVIQPTSSNQAVVSLDVDVTGLDTVDKTAINTNFSSIQTLLNQLRNDLVSVGLIKGS